MKLTPEFKLRVKKIVKLVHNIETSYLTNKKLKELFPGIDLRRTEGWFEIMDKVNETIEEIRERLRLDAKRQENDRDNAIISVNAIALQKRLEVKTEVTNYGLKFTLSRVKCIFKPLTQPEQKKYEDVVIASFTELNQRFVWKFYDGMSSPESKVSTQNVESGINQVLANSKIDLSVEPKVICLKF